MEVRPRPGTEICPVEMYTQVSWLDRLWALPPVLTGGLGSVLASSSTSLPQLLLDRVESTVDPEAVSLSQEEAV